jgi:DNA-directed RNA polymerase specialized sigma24 family protein
VRRLSELEAEQAESVSRFYAEHPDLDDRSFERQQHERRWVGDRNLTTYPIDPHMLNEMDLGAGPGAHSTTSVAPQSDGEFEDTGATFRALFPPAYEFPGPDEDVVVAAFQQMKPEHVSLLQRRYMEMMTLDSIAAEEGVSRQAIIKRLRTAEKKMLEALDGNR